MPARKTGTNAGKVRFTTPFLRIPAQDWASVVHGAKTEFRQPGGASTPSLTLRPAVVVGWCLRRHGPREHRLLVLEDCWREMLGAITPESLEAEGFGTLREFATYWRRRYQSAGYKPLSIVLAYKVRPFRPADFDDFAGGLFEHLYGAFT